MHHPTHHNIIDPSGITLEQCIRWDQEDPLASQRDMFDINENIVYLDGNSLGPPPKATLIRLQQVITQEWGQNLVNSWNDADWFILPRQVGDDLGRLLGAESGQTILADSTSINIYKAVKTALKLRPERRTIIAEADAFPTDLYMLEGAASGYECRLIAQNEDALDTVLDGTVAVVLMSQVNYRTGRLWDMEIITKKVHAVGAIIIWDLCHTVGVLPIELDRCCVDFAVGCTYKYLNGGPGSPAFIYVSKQHLPSAQQPLTGWWGHRQPFAFAPTYQANKGIECFLCGTPPIISLVGAQMGVRNALGSDMNAVRIKSQHLTQLFMDLTADLWGNKHIQLLTPTHPKNRGSQVAFTHSHGQAVVQAMVAKGIIGDFRAPNVMRFGFAPLYLRYCDIYLAAMTLVDCIHGRVWEKTNASCQGSVT